MSRDKQDEPGFASRWSRLKREAKAEPESVADAVEAEAAAVEPPVVDERSDEEVLEELGLPDPDTLKSGDDFTAFMAKTVPARIRNRALRKLWVSDPVFANLDLLLDYGDDFTDKALVIENLQTAYQVGKGFVDKVVKLSEEDAGSGEEPAEESAEELPEEPVETGEAVGADDGDSVDLAEETAPELAPEETGEKAVPEEKIQVRQRMRFRLAEK